MLVGRAPAPWGQLWGQGEAPGDPPFKGSWTGVWAVGRPLLGRSCTKAQGKPLSPSSGCAAELRVWPSSGQRGLARDLRAWEGLSPPRAWLASARQGPGAGLGAGGRGPTLQPGRTPHRA